MNTVDVINRMTGVNRNEGISRIESNRLRRQMEARLAMSARGR